MLARFRENKFEIQWRIDYHTGSTPKSLYPFQCGSGLESPQTFSMAITLFKNFTFRALRIHAGLLKMTKKINVPNFLQ